MIYDKTELWEYYEENNEALIAPYWQDDWDQWNKVKNFSFVDFWKFYSNRIDSENSSVHWIPKYKWLILGWIQLQGIKKQHIVTE